MDGFAFGHLDLPEKEVQHFSFLLPVTNYFRTKHQCLKEGLKGVREEWKETGVWAHRVVRQIEIEAWGGSCCWWDGGQVHAGTRRPGPTQWFMWQGCTQAWHHIRGRTSRRWRQRQVVWGKTTCTGPLPQTSDGTWAPHGHYREVGIQFWDVSLGNFNENHAALETQIWEE